MFGFFAEQREKKRISDDLQETMIIAYDSIRKAIDIGDPEQKHREMHARLTSLSLALHDVYPTFPQEKDSPVTRFFGADLERHPDCESYRNLIEEHVRACPDIPAAKFDFMTYLLAPKFMEDQTNQRKSRR